MEVELFLIKILELNFKITNNRTKKINPACKKAGICNLLSVPREPSGPYLFFCRNQPQYSRERMTITDNVTDYKCMYVTICNIVYMLLIVNIEEE